MKDKFIIFVTMSLWDEPHRGRHHYAMALSEKHSVLWVNRRLSWNEKGPAKTGLEKITDNLCVLHTGKSILPARVDNRLNWNNIKRLRLLRKELSRFGTPDIIWIYDYKAIRFAKYFKGNAVTLYFCNDYFGESAYNLHESRLSQKVDYVFATAPKLVERLKPFNDKCTFLTHGVWPPDQKPEFKKKTKPETVGYVGTLRTVVDTQFLRKIIDETDLHLILAGPVIECDQAHRDEFEALFQHPRVDYRGNLNQNEVNQFISEIDIGLLPYYPLKSGVKKSFRPGLFALKYFDYLVAGKPIVATPYFEWPEPYNDFASVYDEEKSLNKFFTSVYSKWNFDKFEKTLQLADECTWDKRIRKVGEVIGLKL